MRTEKWTDAHAWRGLVYSVRIGIPVPQMQIGSVPRLFICKQSLRTGDYKLVSMKNFLCFFFLIGLAISLKAQSMGTGQAIAPKAGKIQKISWNRSYQASDGSFATDYLFTIEGVGKAGAIVIYNKDRNLISYKLLVEGIEIGQGTYDLEKFKNTEDGNLGIKAQTDDGDFYEVELRFVSSKEENLKILTITNYDYSLILKLDK